jgi:hypothetical protein
MGSAGHYNQSNPVREPAPMSSAMLSDETKQQLEQERLRLVNDRSKIVHEIESSVSAQVDRTLQTLNALLDVPAKVEVPAVDDIVESVSDILEHATTEVPTQSAPRPRKTGTKSTAKPKGKGKTSQPQAFDAKHLKGSFNGKSLRDAILEVMQQDAARVYATDELIVALYDPFEEADLPRARRTLGATFMHLIRGGKVEKVQDKPPHYKFSY